MKKLFFILVFIAVCAPDGWAAWSNEKTARELFFVATLANDWQQTLVIAESQGRREQNKILGSRPNRDNVNIYFAGCLVGHALVTYALPEPYAGLWQDIWVGVQSNTTSKNAERRNPERALVSYRIARTIHF